jgi:Fic-DOC domain mobile mystery protein B
MNPAEVDPAAEAFGAITAKEQVCLLPSLSTRDQLNEIERLGIHAARVWAMRPAVLRRSDLLTEEFSRELHRRMFNGVWRGAGKYRTAGGGPGWEPGQISRGVRMFLDDAEGWLRFSTYSVHESAVRLHHRFFAIQPWANGNGRHARLLADVLVASQGEEPLTWGARSARGEFKSAREEYADAVKAADLGDMGTLLAFARS